MQLLPATEDNLYLTHDEFAAQFTEPSPAKLHPNSDPIRTIYIFDFDQTLVNTPGANEGKQQYKTYHGHPWPHKGWVIQPASLHHPLYLLPGPALGEYFKVYGSHGTRTVILTGRLMLLRAEVERVLATFGVQVDEMFLNPRLGVDTLQFKIDTVKQLLEQYASLRRIELWDDNQEILAGMRMLAAQLNGVELVVHDSLAKERKHQLNSMPPLRRWAVEHCALHSERSLSVVDHALHIVGEAWLDVIGRPEVRAVFDLIRPFGSFPLRKRGDIDVCLLGPHLGISLWNDMLKLEAELHRRGISHTYTVSSLRCPRLGVRMYFVDHACLEIDIVIALLPPEIFARVIGSAQNEALGAIANEESVNDCVAAAPANYIAPPFSSLSSLVESTQRVGDVTNKNSSSHTDAIASQLPAIYLLQSCKGIPLSQASLAGVTMLETVQERIHGSEVNQRDFTDVVSFLVHCARKAGIAGSLFQGLRTFHLVEWVSLSLSSFRAPAWTASHPPAYSGLPSEPTSSALLRHAISYMVRVLDLERLSQSLLASSGVPMGFISRIHSWILDMGRICTGPITPTLLNRLALGVPFPPSRDTHAMVRITCLSPVDVVQWRAFNFLQSRIPECIRGLLDAGVEVSPFAFPLSNTVEFAVPNIEGQLVKSGEYEYPCV